MAGDRSESSASFFALAVSPFLGLGAAFSTCPACPVVPPPGDAAGAGPHPSGPMGDVRGAVLQPRRERRAEGDGRHRRTPRRRRPPRHIRSAAGAMLACGVALTLGTAMGGWRIVRTLAAGFSASPRSTPSPAKRPRPRSSSGPRMRERRSRRPRSSPRRSSAWAAAGAAGDTSAGRSCARWSSPGCSPPAAAVFGAVTFVAWNAIL